MEADAVIHFSEKRRQTWYRGDVVNFLPTFKHLTEYEDPIEEFHLKGFLPEEAFISRDTLVMTFGSCFADHIRGYLGNLGVKQHLIKYKRIPIVHANAALNTTFVLLQQFEWAWEGRTFDEALWFDDSTNEIEALEAYREETRKAFDKTDVFIITLGLSEVWYNKKTGDVFWRGIPVTRHDPELHGFRLSTVEENTDNINKIIALGKKHNPNARFIFTLSPVPLLATFRWVNCIAANSVSKAILRVAIDQVMEEHRGQGVYYWPSYEMIKEGGVWPYKADNRHVKDEILNTMMERFAKYYVNLGGTCK